MLNVRLELSPLTARVFGPGPTMSRFLPRSNSPLRFVIVPATAKVMTSPSFALAMAARSEPAPLSTSVVTTTDAAWLLKAASESQQITAASKAFQGKDDRVLISV
jgi:hypothetical protein